MRASLGSRHDLPDPLVTDSADAQRNRVNVAAWALFAVAVGLVGIARIHLAALPLERDEGEYAYTAQLILQGIPPYQLAYSMKFPGTAASYAVLMSVFGQTSNGLHFSLLIVNLITIVLVLFLGWRIIGKAGGAIAAATYAVLSLMPYVLGQAAHATHFVAIWAVAGALLLHRAVNQPSSRSLFASGLLFGLGSLAKQPGLSFVLFGVAYIGVHSWRAGVQLKSIFVQLMIFVCGAIAPLLITCLALWRAGVFSKFWFWAVSYAQQYGTRVSPIEGARILVANLPVVVGTAWPAWSLGLVGLLLVALNKRYRAQAGFVTSLALFSFLAVCSGFYFRPHYFIVLLPAISILVGIALTEANRFVHDYRALRFAPIGLFALLLLYPIWKERDFFFRLPPPDTSRMVNGTNPFLESVNIGDFLRRQTSPDDTIAVLGSEPEIYFYSQRRSATGYIYTYALMEPQPYARTMQQEMIREIETARPKFLVLVVVKSSWLASADSDQAIFRWADIYCDANYEEVALINIRENGTDYYFSTPPTNVKPSLDHILIYRRKT